MFKWSTDSVELCLFSWQISKISLSNSMIVINGVLRCNNLCWHSWFCVSESPHIASAECAPCMNWALWWSFVLKKGFCLTRIISGKFPRYFSLTLQMTLHDCDQWVLCCCNNLCWHSRVLCFWITRILRLPSSICYAWIEHCYDHLLFWRKGFCLARVISNCQLIQIFWTLNVTFQVGQMTSQHLTSMYKI